MRPIPPDKWVQTYLTEYRTQWGKPDTYPPAARIQHEHDHVVRRRCMPQQYLLRLSMSLLQHSLPALNSWSFHTNRRIAASRGRHTTRTPKGRRSSPPMKNGFCPLTVCKVIESDQWPKASEESTWNWMSRISLAANTPVSGTHAPSLAGLWSWTARDNRPGCQSGQLPFGCCPQIWSSWCCRWARPVRLVYVKLPNTMVDLLYHQIRFQPNPQSRAILPSESCFHKTWNPEEVGYSSILFS